MPCHQKRFFNIQSFDDNQCFKRCLIRYYLHPADHYAAGIRKVDKMFERELNFKDIKLSVKISDILKIEKKNYIGISVFGFEIKVKYPVSVPRNTFKKHVDSLLLEGKDKRHYVLIKKCKTFTYNYTLHRGRKLFCRYCIQAVSTEEILKCCIYYCFKINGKHRMKMARKGKYVKFKNYERKIKLLFMIYEDFESTLVLEDNEKKIPDESYTNKYQKHVVFSYVYKLLCVDDKFRLGLLSRILVKHLNSIVISLFNTY